ncbi:fumarylacetoacetate hydrolase family protein [Streptomyces carpinensis]|uniref:Fumarylacetoacetate hydrolase family protein n=1 Tax=Streptomyces carpinensis TaxID=66369 RepID=A0ABV1VYI7_9ACTN|nr:fumarylacetoacetate hydrolase family protein [Streptomyces carpinensis]
MPSWSLTTCQAGAAAPGSRVAAIRRADGRFVIPDVLRKYDGLLEALNDWDTVAPLLRDLEPDELEPANVVETLSLRHPRKLLCVGANHRDHVAEMGVQEIPDGTRPYFFTVPPTTTMVGDGEPILIPEGPALRVDWEAELAVVIGRGGRDIAPHEALHHVAGYACFNDITARGLLRREVALAAPFAWDWLGSKGLDTFCPIGAVTPAWQVPDPDDLTIRCLVNGVVKQEASTENLITGIAELVAAASASWTLEPGDVIATGTPAGVGQSRGEQLSAGDEVRVEITGLAPLHNPVRHRSPSPLVKKP